MPKILMLCFNELTWRWRDCVPECTFFSNFLIYYKPWNIFITPQSRKKIYISDYVKSSKNCFRHKLQELSPESLRKNPLKFTSHPTSHIFVVFFLNRRNSQTVYQHFFFLEKCFIQEIFFIKLSTTFVSYI